LNKNNHYLYCGNLRDKFGESGIIYVIIASVSKSSLVIQDWVMSCRVFGRGVEEAAFNHLSDWVKKKKIDKIEVNFKKTEKNKYLQETIKNFSFKENKNILSLDRKNIKKFNTQIQINEIKTY
jgi:FkbH-like protein